MSRHWEARSSSTAVEAGAVFRVDEGPVALPPEALSMYTPFNLITGDGAVHRGIVAAFVPGHISIRLDDITVHLFPAPPGNWTGPASDGRYSDWLVDRTEANLFCAEDPSAGVEPPAGEAEEEAHYNDFAEGQLPGMPVSHDPLRELGPTPAQVSRRPRD